MWLFLEMKKPQGGGYAKHEGADYSDDGKLNILDLWKLYRKANYSIINFQ